MKSLREPEHDLVSGDGQTLERVKAMLCKELGLHLPENVTFRNIVGVILDWKYPRSVAATAQPNPAFAAPLRTVYLEVPPELLSASNASEIVRVCSDLASFLLEKNKSYGDSAVNPVRVFSKADPVEQLRVRMDDKLSRLMRGSSGSEDALKDLVGYWVLLQVVQARENNGK